MSLLVWFILLLSLTNLLRMASQLVIGDWYTVRQARAKRLENPQISRQKKLPVVSIVVPAYNEEVGIARTLESIRRLNYPHDRLEVIIVNDGSRDATEKLARATIATDLGNRPRSYFARLPRGGALTRRYVRTGKPDQFHMVLVTQMNQGKATALNNGITQYAKGELIMCLDADSLLDTQAIWNGVRYFQDPEVVALASNINIIEDGTLLGLTQRFEYLIAHQIKKAQTVLNVDYIIGGIGSMFRRSILDHVEYYDTNTMTEDIDLTMKIVAAGNKQYKLVYGADVIAYTEAVPTFRSLIQQRYRWKYGRLQTFLKNTDLFFNRESKYSKLLTCFVLPVTLLQECIFLFEPLVVAYIVVSSIRMHSLATFSLALVIIGLYTLVNLWGSEQLTIRERLRLTYYAPAAYFLMYVVSAVDYVALFRSVWNLHGLRDSIDISHVTWISPERSGAAAAL